MTFGHQCNEEQSVSILNAAKDHGFTFIDTADVYPIGDMTSGYGATEEILGRWLTGQRDNFILATKCYAPTGPNKWDQGNSRKNIIRAAEESLRRLKTDYIDVYQLHFYDDRVSHDESLSALDDLVRSGKVRYIGCSNYLAYQLATALGRSDGLVVGHADARHHRAGKHRRARRTGQPQALRWRAATKPSPPLLPGPQRTSVGRAP
jgi:aryl-alcohol dehydrogenase (NADP+)